jgi:hypothetical protein
MTGRPQMDEAFQMIAIVIDEDLRNAAIGRITLARD